MTTIDLSELAAWDAEIADDIANADAYAATHHPSYAAHSPSFHPHGSTCANCVVDTHRWNDEFCSCGQDTVTCQVAGERVCGDLTTWVEPIGNVCWMHNNTRHPDTIMARLTDPRFARAGESR